MSAEVPRPDPPDSAPGDLDLVEQARHGDYAAFEELIRRYQRRIYALVYNMTGHREDAEDLVQDVFIKAYRSLDGFKGDASFFTWIYRIAVNRTINFLKRRKREAADLRLDDMDPSAERDPAFLELRSRESPVREVTLGELQKKLNAALQNLSEKHRTVVVLHDIQGMPHEEIAKIMKCSVGTVRSRLFYARQHLQRELSEFAP
ncbi:MAG: sigma-70 family RNA polymerase sigma factor [Kiritimatiellae bacterium]|nr:sigma-70 family RNA polymerase sigma factor [Kiritimatiellia bacterium]MDW8458921.1 sigma-70 family RNA polymerase sigma factor [Verrucomicrobiota bacterium]